VKTVHRRRVLRRALSALQRHPDMDFERVLPDLVYGWGNESHVARADLLRTIWKWSHQVDGPILECGSGLSTLILAVAARQRGLHVWTLEHLPQWATMVTDSLRTHGLSNVELCHRSLRDFGAYQWYDAPMPEMPTDFELVVCDGPPGETTGGRYGFLPRMRNNLAERCVIILDDTVRVAEREILTRWSLETSGSMAFIGDQASVGLLQINAAAAS
jgi:predicted O-methyltransferase YrrM